MWMRRSRLPGWGRLKPHSREELGVTVAHQILVGTLGARHLESLAGLADGNCGVGVDGSRNEVNRVGFALNGDSGWDDIAKQVVDLDLVGLLGVMLDGVSSFPF